MMETTSTGETTHGLLCRMREQQVASNREEMARARTMVELFQRFSADYKARHAADPHFTAAPLTETVTETEAVTGHTPGRIRADIEAVQLLDAYLPWLAEYVDAGRLDLYRAKVVTDAVRDELVDQPAARERFATLMRDWFARAAAGSPGLVNRTIKQIRNHVRYLLAKVLPSEMDDRFKRRHAQRRVTSTDTGDGMAQLAIDTDAVSARLAARRLDMMARDARKAGDERTLEQLRSDLAIDLLTGIPTTTTAGAGKDLDRVGAWARPVINVTVPIQTLMGLSDEPGMIGDQVLPPSLIRHVAAAPNATWYRLLTDPHRQGVELSTESYKPTAPITREVLALNPTCFAPTCGRDAAECEIDHETPFPEGETRTGNLGPGCHRHHMSKHNPGASLTREPDGTLRYKTRAGITHLVAPAEVPVCEDPETAAIWERLIEIQPNVAELCDAIDEIRFAQMAA
jgi:hypothetical protein